MTGEELKALREKLGFTQTEFGQRVGVARNTVTRWETGLRRIPEPVVRLASYLAKEVRTEKQKKKR